MKHLQIALIFFFVLFISCTNTQKNEIKAEINAIENNLETYIQIKGDSTAKFNILDRMDYHKVPGISIAVVKNGKIHWAKGYGASNNETGKKVTTKTKFQAGSISKPVAALAALKLVDENKINLTDDVNNYLTDWKIPENDFNKVEKVTLEKILTHTAGMTIHGFPGYAQTDSFPTIIQVLNGTGNTEEVVVDTFPGSIWRYSGGGYTVMEKVVEDVSGLPLEEYMDQHILGPMGLNNSTYEQPINSKKNKNISAAHNGKGELVEGLYHNYPEQAAAGLWTTPSDLARYCIEIQDIYMGRREGLFLKETMERMLTKHKNGWGLGPATRWDGDSLMFRHGGANKGFRNSFNAFAKKGDAVIVMTNGDNGMRLINEILLGISIYYDWGMISPRIIEPVLLTIDEYHNFIGSYKSEEEWLDDGDYIIDVRLEGDKLILVDTIENIPYKILPTDSVSFIDVDSGTKFVFEKNEKGQIVGFKFAGTYPFEKIM